MLGASAKPSDRAATPHVQAQLVVHAPQGIAPGQPLALGLLLTHQPDWHTYWKNAGDSGLPTQLDWDLPLACKRARSPGPCPSKFALGDLLNYGYEGQVLLPVPTTVGADFAPDSDGMVRLGVRASWLVCRVECIPEEVQLQIRLPVAQSHVAFASNFVAASAKEPKHLESIYGEFTVNTSGDRLDFVVKGLPAEAHGQELAFYPEAADTFRHAAVLGQDWQQRWRTGSGTPACPCPICAGAHSPG